ncbi:MAG TPA: DUF2892 domain-containing protein [Flavobacteriales bacterium]|jgi:hypothetical protein|nr:DUF2892 domain-containing protein [Flavobacteriales bacterium]
MVRNLGWLDRSVRLLIALLLLVVYLNGWMHGVLALCVLVIGAALVLTSAMGVCPLYLRLGVSTLRRKGHTAQQP